MAERIPEVRPTARWLEGQPWGADSVVGLEAQLTWDEEDAAAPQAIERFLNSLSRGSDRGSPGSEPVYFSGGFTVRVSSRSPGRAVLVIESAGEDGLDSAQWGAQLLTRELRLSPASLTLHWAEREPRHCADLEPPRRGG